MQKLRTRRGSTSGSARIGFLLMGTTAIGTLALATGLVAPGLASARSAHHPSTSSITASPYSVQPGSSVVLRGLLPCAPEGSTGTVTDAQGAVVGTSITFGSGGAFRTDVPVGTPGTAGVDTLAIGSPACGLAAPITIASPTVIAPLGTAAPGVAPPKFQSQASGTVSSTAEGNDAQGDQDQGGNQQGNGVSGTSSSTVIPGQFTSAQSGVRATTNVGTPTPRPHHHEATTKQP